MRDEIAASLARLGVAANGFEFDQVAHNRWLTPGIWRVRLDGRSYFLKSLRAERPGGESAWDAHWTARSDETSHWNYWAREGLAYRVGLTDAWSGAGIYSPACVASARDDQRIDLLLEDVHGLAGEDWSIDQYRDAAHALGRAQGPFLTGKPAPTFDWLSRGFLRDYNSEKPVDWELLDDDMAWSHPIVRQNFPSGLREGANRLHAARLRLYSIAESLPRTLCHLDFWTKNLIKAVDGRVVLLDWALVGDGAPGEDIGNLILDAVFDHFIAADAISDLEQTVFAGYLDGLRSAGWRGNPDVVRLGMWASSVKYDWLTPLMLAAANAPRQLRYGGVDQIDVSYRFRERGVALAHATHWATNALELGASAL